MNSMNPKVDGYLRKAKTWQEEMEKLRRISLDCGLTEELKWGKPCYTFQKSNIVIIQGFKEFCAFLFCKGALLNDPKGILKKFGWQAARRIPFTNVREIVEMEPILKAYIHEAIEVEKAGLEVNFKKDPEPVPEELQKKFAEFTSSLPFRYSVTFMVRLRKFNSRPPLFGLSSFLSLSFRDIGCFQAYSSPSLASRYGSVHITFLE